MLYSFALNFVYLAVYLAILLQLYDQYLNFVSLEEDFFITRQQNTRELSYYGNGGVKGGMGRGEGAG